MDDNTEEFLSQEDIEEVIELDEDYNPEDGDTVENDTEVGNIDYEEMVDIPDESVSKFTEHNEAVLCCDVSHDDKLVVTGGQDDKAFVWKSENKEILFETSGHKDSIVAVKFNKNSSMVATGDLSGIIQVWSTGGELLYNFEVDDLNWMLWHPIAENVLLAGTNCGDTWMWKLSKTNLQCKTFQSFGHSSVTAKIFNDGKRIVIGYEDGSIRVWDLKDAQVLSTLKGYHAHSESVISIDINPDNSLIASGSTDSTVKIINANNYKMLMTLSCGATNTNDQDESDSIESISFASNNLLAVGSVNGSIEIWDISSQIKRSNIKLDFGVSKIIVSKTDPNILYAGGLDSIFRVIDIRNCEIILTKTGHTNQILDFCISSDSKYALTASEDSTCRIYLLEQ